MRTGMLTETTGRGAAPPCNHFPRVHHSLYQQGRSRIGTLSKGSNTEALLSVGRVFVTLCACTYAQSVRVCVCARAHQAAVYSLQSQAALVSRHRQPSTRPAEVPVGSSWLLMWRNRISMWRKGKLWADVSTHLPRQLGKHILRFTCALGTCIFRRSNCRVLALLGAKARHKNMYLIFVKIG